LGLLLLLPVGALAFLLRRAAPCFWRRSPRVRYWATPSGGSSAAGRHSFYATAGLLGIVLFTLAAAATSSPAACAKARTVRQRHRSQPILRAPGTSCSICESRWWSTRPTNSGSSMNRRRDPGRRACRARGFGRRGIAAPALFIDHLAAEPAQ
jgi:hypothetical protein